MLMMTVLVCGIAAFEWNDSFDYPDGTEGTPAWYAESVRWRVEGGSMVFAGTDRSMAILEKAPHAAHLVMEAVVTPQERLGAEWCVAGTGIRSDARNFWHLALIDAPEGHEAGRTFELVEMRDGFWLANSAGDAPLQTIEAENSGTTWDYGQTYRLALAVAPDRIEGTVRDTSGAVLWRQAIRLEPHAVTTGQPMFDCSGMHAAFDDVSVVIRETASPPAPPVSNVPYASPAPGPALGEGTGFFATAEKDGRWWFKDPEGNAFYAVATDHISYHVHWCQDLGYAPYHRFVAKKYGSEEAWAAEQADRLRAWGFNAAGVNHSHALRRLGFPYPEFAQIGTTFSSIDDLCPRSWWTGFPNVFSPDWPRHCDKMARKITDGLKNDPWLLGYMIDNELEWYGKSGTAWGLFDEAWKKPGDHTAKLAWVAFLREHLDGPEAFAELWGVEVESWEALGAHTEPAPPRTDEARAIARDWVRLVAERYFSDTAAALRRHDPNHLILGTRFAGQAPDVWDIAGKHCDVVTFNMYPRISIDNGVPEDVFETIHEWQALAGRPMWLTEWSFPALDAGLPSTHGAGMRVDTQEQRTQCFSHFQEALFRLPFMVGSSFFMYIDEPELGISHDFPENSNYGLIDGEDRPYPALTGAAAALNPRVVELHTEGNPRIAGSQHLADWLSTPPARNVSGAPASGRIEAGGLVLDGPSEGRVRVTWNGRPLGDWHPLLQVTREGLVHWLRPNGGRVVEVRQDDRMTVATLSFTLDGKGVEPSYRAEYELWIPRDRAWFGSKLTRVENTSGSPWSVGMAYHYFTPALGGSPEGDGPIEPPIPNYHVNGGAWVDPESGLGVACWFPEGAPYQCYYWKDESFHADLSIKIEARLEPGESVTSDAPQASFFPLDQPDRAGFGAAAVHLAGEVLETGRR
jgi:hypothetical protein